MADELAPSEHASPHPVSRLAPPFGLVDLAREVERADAQLTARAGAQLEVIVEQIRHLQKQAHAILERTADHQSLHRAECRFTKRPGQCYHLYRRADGSRYFSMLSPEDWRGSPPDTPIGGYRLELDLTWTPLDGEPDPDQQETRAAVRALLEGKT